MVRKASEMGVNHYENMRGGNLSVDAAKFLEASDSYGAGSFFGRASMQPGASIGYHQHVGEYEIYYILSGTAEVSDNGVIHVLKAGDMMQCRDGDSHSIANIGDDTLEFLAMVIFNHEKKE
jgi:quercetin dioxygenase-like cupin family protein